MPTNLSIAGILGLEDSSATLVNVVGQQLVYDAVQEFTQRLAAELNLVTGLFVEKQTTDHQFRYYMHGTRELQRQGGMGRPGEQKHKRPYYDVALPIFQWGDALGGDFISMAYMTIADVDAQMVEITNAARSTLRKEILSALFNNTSLAFTDPIKGALTVQPLANQDGTMYAPVPGSEDLAEIQNYAESGYLVSAISDTNDPIKAIADKLLARYPEEVDGLVFCATDVAAKVQAVLTDFYKIDDPRIDKGGLADRLTGIPGTVPGKIIGRVDNMWVSHWAELPTTYCFGICPSAEKPLQQRVDLPGTGLPATLTLMKQSDLYPLEKSEWMWRFGMGCVNRLNGYALEVAAGGSYTVPTKYAR
jgi:hypothetical protein